MRTYRASSKLICLSVIVLVIWRLSITVHSHDVGKHRAGPVILIRIEEDAEAFEVVLRSEDWAGCCALLGEPHCETVAVEVALAGDLEFHHDLVA